MVVKSLSHFVLGIGISIILVYQKLVPDAALFREPYFARIMFTHVPCAMLCSAYFIICAWHGFQTLRKYNNVSAAKLHASSELAALYAALTMATGIVFSKYQWGEWWHNDPKQVSFLIVLFLYVSLIALRGAYNDEIRRDRNTAGYALALLLPGIFLTFVYPRLKFVEQQTFHPNNTIPEGQLDLAYSIGLYGTLLGLAFLSAFVFKLRVKTELQLREIANYGPNETDRRRSPSHGVVRPVAIPSHDKE